jgi:hypothetical protein
MIKTTMELMHDVKGQSKPDSRQSKILHKIKIAVAALNIKDYHTASNGVNFNKCMYWLKSTFAVAMDKAVHCLIFMQHIHLNPQFSWCTICMSFSWMTIRSKHVRPCWQCKDTNTGQHKPPICNFTTQVLLQWGHTHNKQGRWVWHNMQGKMITTSNAYVTINIKGFKTKPKLYHKKASLKAKQAATFATTHSNKHKDKAQQKYSHNTRQCIYQLSLIPLPNHPWLSASPNSLTNNGILVKIKCPMSRSISNGAVQLQSISTTELNFVQYKLVCEDWPLLEEEFAMRCVKCNDVWFVKKLPVMCEFYEMMQNAKTIKCAAMAIMIEVLRTLHGKIDVSKS